MAFCFDTTIPATGAPPVNTGLLLLIITVAVALAFDFLNGFHDAANSIATVVSTRVLSPKLAVVWAAFFNFVAAFLLGTAVAKTIGKGMIRLDDVTQYVVIAGLAGAIVWDLLTWWWGLPTSSSHALIGGYAGAAMTRAALNHGMAHAYSVILPQGWTLTLIFIVVAPIMGLVLALMFSSASYWILRNRTPGQVDKWFRKLQLLSAAAYSLGHGGNDAQKTMGIIAGALFTAGYMTPDEITHEWGHYKWFIILSAHTAIALGTYFGGWRIVHTMGSKITKLRPLGGFCAESCGSHNPVRDCVGWHSGQHHAHYYRGDYRSRGDPSPVGRAVGSGTAHCVGVDHYDSGFRRRRLG